MPIGFIETEELRGTITQKTVTFAEDLGKDLVKGDGVNVEPLTTTQLRKFFGEVKRQQLKGYSPTSFIMLKPKLAYAVGRAKQKAKNSVWSFKIEDFYEVIAKAIDDVASTPEDKRDIAFKNFIAAFEAIVAYHKVAEEDKKSENNKKKDSQKKQ